MRRQDTYSVPSMHRRIFEGHNTYSAALDFAI